MPFSDIYRRQVALLVRVLPFVAEQKVFALKGGTAINLFARNMPRLSVDIDLTYLPVQPRPQSLAAINNAMNTIAKRLSHSLGAEITSSTIEGAVTTLYVRVENAQIKIEVTPVLRGCVFEPENRRVSAHVEETFGFAEMQVVSFADLYAGKIIAALDRQHPRDLFDVSDLLANEGISDELRSAVVVYLLSHNRPMHEVLAPVRKPLKEEFVRGFQGMTDRDVMVEELSKAREALIESIVGKMPNAHQRFLISFENGQPDWALLGLPHVIELPAVKWRMLNLDKLSPRTRADLVKKLELALNYEERS